MVLAAGLGTRLRPFTEQIPKPLMPVLGNPCIDYALLSLRASQISKIVVNVHAHADQFKTALSSDIIISDESAQLLGSAGGFRQALPHFEGEAFLALNADVISAVPLAALVKRHEELKRSRGIKMTLAIGTGALARSQTESYSEILLDESTGLIQGLNAKSKTAQGKPFYLGTGVFESECFSHLAAGKPAEWVSEVLKPLLQAKQVAFFSYDGLWLDMGTPELWWKAHFELHQKLNQLPAEWQAAIQKPKMPFLIDFAQKTVDYSYSLGKNSIRIQNISYEIPSAGN